MNKSKSKSNSIHGGGLRDTWKLWRHCLCRHGWYPLIVAPFITAAGLLDMYSSLDCRFIRVNVGFTPVNKEWSKPFVDMGFWTYHSGIVEEISPPIIIGNDTFNSTDMETNVDRTTTTTNEIKSFDDSVRSPSVGGFRSSGRVIILPGCSAISNHSVGSIIEGDRAWAAARIMAQASGIASLISIATIWLMTLCPLPACFVWPGVLLPATLVGFLAGGAKFFILDSTICKNRVWLRANADTSETAQSCSLQLGAISSISSMVCFFICICLIFYNVPEKRELDPFFGLNDDEFKSDQDLEKGQSEKCHSRDPSMEMIPEDVPFVFETPRNKYLSGDIETRDTSTPPQETENGNNIISQSNTLQEDRDDENDGLDAVMTKIGIYLKESGSQIDFEKSIPIPKSKSQQRMKSLSLSPKDPRRSKSQNKLYIGDDSHIRSAVSYSTYESKKSSKYRERLSRADSNISRGESNISLDKEEKSNSNQTKVEKSSRDESLCDISAITMENMHNIPSTGKDFEGPEVSAIDGSMKSSKSIQKQIQNSKKTDIKYRAY